VSELTVHVAGAGAGPLLELTGDLDLHTTPQIHDALSAVTLEPGGQLVVDLSGVTFCDSTGITGLLTARNSALEAGAEIALTGLPAHLTQMFHIVGLDTVFAVYPTVADAREAWPGQAR
jgi:anti-sigma B factor antagonist